MFDVNEVRKDFPMIRNNKDLIYFDSGATSFKPQCVIDAVMDIILYTIPISIAVTMIFQSRSQGNMMIPERRSPDS